MSRYFHIQITGGTSPGPYTIYYDNVLSSNIALKQPSNTPATNISLISLSTPPGVLVAIPDASNSVILFNNECSTSDIISLASPTPTTNCFCLSVYDSSLGTTTQYQFCTTGATHNGKPLYTTTVGMTDYNLEWDSYYNYWRVTGLTINSNSLVIRSTDTSDLPLTSFTVYGGPWANYYTATATSGICGSPSNVYFISCTETNPSCFNTSDGSIISVANGGNGGWSYSLDGIIYNNYTGIFTGLPSGTYTVYAKDISGNTTNCIVNLTGPAPSNYFIPIIVDVPQYSSTIGNMIYYKSKFVIDTTALPIGLSVSFEVEMDFSMSYNEPNVVLFDTTQPNPRIFKNALPVNSALTGGVGFTSISPFYCSTYSTFVGNDVYTSVPITMTNTDTTIGTIFFGIDTATYGAFVNPCITSGTVVVNVSLKNLVTNQSCVDVIANPVSTAPITQTY